MIPAVEHFGVDIGITLTDFTDSGEAAARIRTHVDMVGGNSESAAVLSRNHGGSGAAVAGNGCVRIGCSLDMIAQNPAALCGGHADKIPAVLIIGIIIVFVLLDGSDNGIVHAGAAAHIDQCAVYFKRTGFSHRSRSGSGFLGSRGCGSSGCGGCGRGIGRGIRIGTHDPAAQIGIDPDVVPLDIFDGFYVGIGESLSQLERGQFFGRGRGACANIENGSRHLERTAFRGGGGCLRQADEGAEYPALRGGIDLDIVPVNAVHIFDIGIQEVLPLFERCDFLSVEIGVRADVENFAGNF